MDLKDLISSSSSQIRHLYLSDVIGGLFFHTVFIQNGDLFKPYVLFENGNSLEIQTDKTRSYFEYGGTKYYFLNGGKLCFASGIVNHPSIKACTMVIDQKCPDKGALYLELSEMLNGYYDFYCEEERRIVATHIIHSYLLNLIGSTFYLMLEGDFNTGKSSLQMIMSLLQYNGFFSGQITMPTLVRKIHHYQGTANIDEFDKLSPEARQNALAILNSGMYQGGTYEITNMNKRTTSDQIEIIQAFSAKTFSANKIHLDSSLQSRCVVIHTVRANRLTKSTHAICEDEKERIQGLRDKIFAYCLMNGRQMLEMIRSVRAELAEKGFNSRRADILSIIVGIEREFCLDSRVFEYLTDKEGFDEDDAQDEDREFHMYEFLLSRCVSTGREVIEFQNKDMVDYINEKLGYSDLDHGLDEKFKATAVSVGKMLKHYKVAYKKEDRRRITSGCGKGRYEYRLNKLRVIDLIKRCRYKQFQSKADEFLKTPQPIKSGDDLLPF